MARSIAFNVLQVLFVVALAPLVSGVLNRLKEIVQSRRGPSIFQPYRDLRKLFSKDEVVSEHASWLFRFTPYVVFVAPIFVTTLIPVLTNYPLFFAFMGDMLGAGFVLALGGFFATLAAIDTANPYGPMGASRTRMVGSLAEPAFMIVFFTVSFIAGSTIPYIVQAQWVTLPEFFAPSHVLLVIAFVMLILAESGHLPVDNPSGHFELAMIDESKSLEYSGTGMALMKWGGQMKLLVLMCVLLNVLVTPWGLASGKTFADVVFAAPFVLFKIGLFILVLVVIESSLSKLRLFRVSELLGAAFVTSVVAMITLWTIPSLAKLTLSLDRLSALFLFITGLVLLPASIFASGNLSGYLRKYSLRTFSVSYFALFATLVLIPLSADALSFLMLWELMSILIYLLVNYEHETREHTRSGYIMLAIGEAGTILIAIAFIILARNGSLEFAAMKAAGGGLGADARWAVFLLAFFGFGVKAGLIPVNFWLPQAYTSAPLPFVPVLAGATLNLGLYGIVRVNGDLLPAVTSGPGLVALVIGSVTAILGILYATTQSDLKTLLAHSSIENAGIITAALGAGFVFVASRHYPLAAIAFAAALYQRSITRFTRPSCFSRPARSIRTPARGTSTGLEVS